VYVLRHDSTILLVLPFCGNEIIWLWVRMQGYIWDGELQINACAPDATSPGCDILDAEQFNKHMWETLQ
jgi:hypothetical protein